MSLKPPAFPLDPATFPDFPVRGFIPRIRTALGEQGMLILGAATGAGKSTLVPPALRGLPFMEDKKVLVLQPQRISTWAIATRIGSLCGLGFGPELGLVTSRGREGSPDARIQVMTSGVFLRMVQDDPSLEDVGCVVFDEFHQRSWQADLALSFCLEAREVFNPALRILVMSATLDARGLGVLMPGAASLEVPGSLFPVDQEWLSPPPEAQWWKNRREFLSWTARQIRREWDGIRQGNLLCFLPGLGEIRSVRAVLENLDLPPGTVIHELHSSTPDQAQARALDAPDHGQIFLASSIAETGLTLRGVVLVVDSGLSRLKFFDPRLGMNSLQTHRVSLDSSLQRQGRAGRTSRGRCLKLWPREEILDTRRLPDLQRSDLSSFILEASLWGARRIGDLRLVDLPGRSLWNSGVTGLQETGVLMAVGPTGGDPADQDDSFQTHPGSGSRNDEWLVPGIPSPLAREVSALGLHPRLAQAVLKAQTMGTREAAFVLALASFMEYRSTHPAALGQNPVRDRQDPAAASRGKTPHHASAATDILPVVDQLFSRSGGTEIHDQYLKAGSRLWNFPREKVPSPPLSTDISHAGLCQGIQPLWMGRLVERQGSKALYLLAQGRQATLGLEMNHPAPAWIAALELETGTSASVIRLYAPLDETWCQGFQKSCPEEIRVSWEGLSWKAVACKAFGALVFSETPVSLGSQDHRPAVESAVRSAFGTMLGQKGIELLPWNEDSLQLYWRMARARESGLFSFTDHEEPPQERETGRFFDSHLNHLIRTRGAESLVIRQGQPVLSESGLMGMLENLLSWKQREMLDQKLPPGLVIPGRRSVRLDYSGSPSGLPPQVELRLKDAFGIHTHPHILGQPVVFHLLSPAGRPVQVTSDLPGFWSGTWKEVRKDMKGRYPKHDWPENPLIPS